MNKILTCLLIGSAFVLSCPEPLQASIMGQFEVPKLTLSAQATIRKPADELQMRVGVVTLSDTAQEALAENSARMQDVINSLKEAGLTKDDYETGHFSISPTYTPYPKNPPPDWKQTINGYEVKNSVFIHTISIESAGKFIDVANKAGANSIDNITFTLHDHRQFWDEAVSTATAHAIHDAETIADAANLKLVRILSITLDNNGVVTPRTNNMYYAKGMASEAIPPIEAGDVAITANVTVTYEVASR